MINIVNFLGPVVDFYEKINTHSLKMSKVLRDCHIFMDFKKFGNDIKKQSATRRKWLDICDAYSVSCKTILYLWLKGRFLVNSFIS